MSSTDPSGTPLHDTASPTRDHKAEHRLEVVLVAIGLHNLRQLFVTPFPTLPTDEPALLVLSDETLNTYAAERAAFYKCHDADTDDVLLEEDLFLQFREDFEGWTTLVWKKLHPVVRKAMKKVLRRRNLWIGGDEPGARIDQQLGKITSGQEKTWQAPEGERSRVLEKCDSAFKRVKLRQELDKAELNDRMSRFSTPPPKVPQQQQQPAPQAPRQQQPQQLLRQQATASGHAAVNPNIPSGASTAGGVSVSGGATVSGGAGQVGGGGSGGAPPPGPEVPWGTYRGWPPFGAGRPIDGPGGQPRGLEGTGGPGRPSRPAGGVFSAAYWAIPPVPLNNGTADTNAVVTFTKIWKRDNDYTGKQYEVLDDKISIFYKTCRVANVQPDSFFAVFPHILAGEALIKLNTLTAIDATFSEQYQALKTHFEHQGRQTEYYTTWGTISYATLRADPANAQLSAMEVLQKLFDKLLLLQHALGPSYNEDLLIQNTKRATQGRPEFGLGVLGQPPSSEEQRSRLRASLEAYESQHGPASFLAESATYLAERRYGRNDGKMARSPRRDAAPRTRKCWVCGKIGCWSTQHTPGEREKSRAEYNKLRDRGLTNKGFTAFLLDVEGEKDDFVVEGVIEDTAASEGPEIEEPGNIDTHAYFTSAAPESPFSAPYSTDVGARAVQYLCDCALRHRIQAGRDESEPAMKVPAHLFHLDRYSAQVFQGILPDTGAAVTSTGGFAQFEALKSWIPSTTLDTTKAGEEIHFGDGPPSISVGTTELETPLGRFVFHILKNRTPFLLCLADLDASNTFLDNTRNLMCQRGTRSGEVDKLVPVVRKWGHPWFFLGPEAAASSFLTESELRRLHKRFGHPSVDRLARVLDRAGHDVPRDTLAAINRFCHACQINGSAPQRFRFTLNEDRDFNSEIVVDVVHLGGRPVLHVVDTATAFNAARFLVSQSAKDTWEALKLCWIDTYLGPPDVVRSDAGTNFASEEFQQAADAYGITCKVVPVEAHWSVGKIERYHAPLRRAWGIFDAELGKTASEDAKLQMAIKAINDTAGPDGLVPTLLVFGAMPRMTKESPPSPSTLARAQATTKALAELRKLHAARSVSEGVAARRGPDTADVQPMLLAIGAEVIVYREAGGWKGPYKVLATSGTDVTVDMTNGPTTFRATHVRPYRRDDHTITPETTQPRRRGRPKGSLNKRTLERMTTAAVTDANSQLVEQFFQPADDKPTLYVIEDLIEGGAEAFLSKKEREDNELALQLRSKGIITTPGEPFEASDRAEVAGLTAAGVMVPIAYDGREHAGIRVFKARFVHEVKDKLSKPYEKSRLVIQGFNDLGKATVLTQSPTIQRCSQRLIFALAPSLMTHSHDFDLQLRDITQAYTQSRSDLHRLILAEVPPQLKRDFPEGTVLWIKRPLYGIAEAGLHWFETYSRHHQQALGMEPSPFDPCLLVTRRKKIPDDDGSFGITGLQTDDTLNLGNQAFLAREEQELQRAGFKAKPRTVVTAATWADFNGCRLRLDSNGTDLLVTPKGQGDKITTIGDNDVEAYVVQRARGAYVASICQPEAAFDLSVAAQFKAPEKNQFKALNARLAWQTENKDKGLRYVPIDLTKAKLVVFVDGSFANNADLTSQIGYVVALVNERQVANGVFALKGNLVHWTSTKCKRVTRSVLASEIYGMVAGFDLGHVLSETLRMVADELSLPVIPLVICTDSLSLYECLVKLGTTLEKRLMIDLMALRQSYERKEIHTVRWIHGDGNLADAMTKASPNPALARFVNTNTTTIRVAGWVDRPEDSDNEDGEGIGFEGQQEKHVR